MFKKLFFSGIFLPYMLFGGGDSFGLQLSLPLQIAQPVEQAMSQSIAVQQPLHIDSLVIFKGTGFQQPVDSSLFSTLNPYGITNASVSVDQTTGAGIALVHLPSSLTPESYNALQQKMAQSGFFPEKAIGPRGKILVRGDGCWLKLQDNASFSPQEIQALQSLSQQATPPAATTDATPVAQTSTALQHNGASSSEGHHTVSYSCTLSFRQTPLTPRQQEAIRQILGYREALSRQGTSAFTQKDADTIYVTKYQAYAERSMHPLQNESVAEAQQASDGFKQLLEDREITVHNMSQQDRQIMQRLQNNVYAAEARKSQQLTNRIEKYIRNIVKDHKTQKYEAKLEQKKEEIFADYYKEHFFNFHSEDVLRDSYRDNQRDIAAAESVVKKCTTIVGRAGKDAFQPRFNLAKAQFNLDIERGKQRILENLLQRITFTPAYKNDLVALQQKLEALPQNTHTAAHVAAIKETLATNGAVHKATVSCSPEVAQFLQEQGINADKYTTFVGNAYENHIYAETMDNLALATDLHMTSYADQSGGDYARAIAHFSDGALSALTTMPAQAQALTDASTALGQMATGIAKGAVLGLEDAIVAQVKMVADPMGTIRQIDEGLGQLFAFAWDTIKGNPETLTTINKACTEFSQLPLAKQAEHLTRFATIFLMPGSSELARLPGVEKGIQALGAIAKRELAALNVPKIEFATVNGVQVTSAVAKDIATLEKGAGRTFSTEETLAVAKNMERLSSESKAPLTSAFARGVEAGKEIISVNNMKEFFNNYSFGKTLKPFLEKTKKLYDGQAIYKVKETVNDFLKKGYHVYLDGLHKDHLEVFDHRGVFKTVLNLDGTINPSKVAAAAKAGRSIKNIL